MQKKLLKLIFKTVVCFAIATCYALPAAAQDRQVKGKVTETTGGPLPGSTVQVKGTTSGTMTDGNGQFTINVPANATSTSLIISFIGYKTAEVVVGAQDEINISLESEALALEEVVVVGYGEQKKINLTGAVSQIGSEVIENRPAPNVTRLLQGALPNLNIGMSTGAPTNSSTYNIRGTTSIGSGGSALVLIDGVQGNPDLLNASDIASVTILKDASSAAVYGSRAAFGVVLITTKSPQAGKTSVDVSLSQSWNSRTVTPELVTNGYEWGKNFADAFYAWYDYKTLPTSVNQLPFSMDYLDRVKQHDEDPSLPEVVYNESLGRYEYFGNTDWYKFIHKDVMPATDVAVSVTGGSDKANFMLSGHYYIQDGIFNYNSDEFSKYNLRGKGEVKFTKWLSFQNNTDLSSQTYGYPLLANGDGGIWRYFDVVGFPMQTMYNPDGTYTYAGAQIGASFIEGTSRAEQRSTYLRNTAAFIAKPLGELLTLKADFTIAKTFNTDKRYNNPIYYSNAPDHSSSYGYGGVSGASQLRQYNSNINYWTSNVTATLVKSFRESHNLSFLAGANVEGSATTNLNTSRNGLLLQTKPDYNLMDGTNYSITGGGSDWKYLGVFYRVNYDFKNRYLLELNGRYDGSSKFPSNQRFGFFPSVSAGWNILEEGFIQSVPNWLTNLKVRASYGSLGNGNIDPYRYMETMTVSKASVVLGGIQPSYTYLPAVLPDGLTWEKATTFNLGLDVSALDNRLTGVFEWYDRKTTDMFTAGPPLPNVFGAAVPNGNYADLDTKGWELSLSWKDNLEVAGKAFRYEVSGSLWDSKSEITKFNNPTNILSSYYVGQQIGGIWGYTTEGFFATDAEVAEHASQTFLINSNANQWLAGDLKFADINGDGVINQGANTLDDPGDRKIIGNNSPRYRYGINLSASYRGFGISAFFQGIGKRDWYFAPEADLFYGPYNRPYGFQPKIMMDDHWTEENPDAYWPRYRGYTALGTNRSLGAPQTKYLQDASYLRLKNITIDYSLPKSVTEKLGLQQAQLYVSGQNLLTWSKLFTHTKSFDPEVIENPIGDFTSSNGQGDAYPMLKTVTVGVNLKF